MPAIAVFNGAGIRVRDLPIRAEKLFWRGLRNHEVAHGKQ